MLRWIRAFFSGDNAAFDNTDVGNVWHGVVGADNVAEQAAPSGATVEDTGNTGYGCVSGKDDASAR